MDIVIGPAEVPVSVLIRNALASDYTSLSKVLTENTKLVLNHMGVDHHDKPKGASYLLD